MQYYQTKVGKIPGTNMKEVLKRAMEIYDTTNRHTKRRPHIRSKYFEKQKVFLGLFWQHLHEKLNHRDKIRRIKFFPCALDLIKNSNNVPVSKENVDRRSEILHRFGGITKNKEIFFVQIKEDKKSGEKFLISIFPL